MKKWNELSEDVRNKIESIDHDIATAVNGISIKGLWENTSIHTLTDEDKIYLRDEVIRLLKEGRQTLLENNKW